MDQLNTPFSASLYAAFPANEAKRLADRLEIHHTPKHGSWRNLTEIKLSVLARQCLRQWLGDHASLEHAGNFLGRSAQRRHRLAVHDRRRLHQTPATLPGV